MKIVCDACSAKYSISDDKVQGKVFKIRCKKCSNIIVVRGNAQAAQAESTTLDKSTRVLDYGYEEQGQAAGGDAVWHVVIDQDQVGPLTAADVQRRFQAGEIDGDTYIWREGFADWLPMSQVEPFSAMTSGAAAPADDSGALFGGKATAVEPRSSGASAVSDLFAADSGSSASVADDDDGGVFAARRPAAAPADSPSKLRGERGENSVLFSLSNLAQLATDAPRSSSSTTSSPSSSSGAAQHGGGEGSGLIDIRSMASAYLGDKGPAKPAAPGLSSASDLPVFSSTGFGESAAVVVPIVRNTSSGNNRLLYGLIALVGLLAVVAVVMVVVVLKGDKPATIAGNTAAPGTPTPPSGEPETPATAPATSSDRGSAAPAPSTSAPAPSEPTPPPASPSTANPATSEKPPSTATKPRGDRDPAPKKPSSSSSSSGKTTPPKKEEEDEKPAPKPSKGDGGGDCDAVACLVDPSQPCCKKSGGAKPSSGSSGSKGDSNLPEQLDSSMIKAGIDKVKGRAQACGNKSSAKGPVKVRIKALPEGKVGSVDVVSAPDDALGSCVASALRGATFPKTQRGMGFAYTLTF